WPAIPCRWDGPPASGGGSRRWWWSPAPAGVRRDSAARGVVALVERDQQAVGVAQADPALAPGQGLRAVEGPGAGQARGPLVDRLHAELHVDLVRGQRLGELHAEAR